MTPNIRRLLKVSFPCVSKEPDNINEKVFSALDSELIKRVIMLCKMCCESGERMSGASINACEGKLVD